jgi:hypothetical protein
MKPPWTREQLDALVPVIEAKMAEAEGQGYDVHPLPPMDVRECIDYLAAASKLRKQQARGWK